MKQFINEYCGIQNPPMARTFLQQSVKSKSVNKTPSRKQISANRDLLRHDVISTQDDGAWATLTKYQTTNSAEIANCMMVQIRVGRCRQRRGIGADNSSILSTSSVTTKTEVKSPQSFSSSSGSSSVSSTCDEKEKLLHLDVSFSSSMEHQQQNCAPNREGVSVLESPPVFHCILTTTRVQKDEIFFLFSQSMERCRNELAWYGITYNPPLSMASSASSSVISAAHLLDTSVKNEKNQIQFWPRHMPYYHGVGKRHQDERFQPTPSMSNDEVNLMKTEKGEKETKNENGRKDEQDDQTVSSDQGPKGSGGNGHLPICYYPNTMLELRPCPQLGEGQLEVVARADIPYGTCFAYTGIETLNDEVAEAVDDGTNMTFTTSNNVLVVGKGITSFINHRYNFDLYGNVQFVEAAIVTGQDYMDGVQKEDAAALLALEEKKEQLKTSTNEEKNLRQEKIETLPSFSLPPPKIPKKITNKNKVEKSTKKNIAGQEKCCIPFFIAVRDINKGERITAHAYGWEFDAKLCREAVYQNRIRSAAEVERQSNNFHYLEADKKKLNTKIENGRSDVDGKRQTPPKLNIDEKYKEGHHDSNYEFTKIKKEEKEGHDAKQPKTSINDGKLQNPPPPFPLVSSAPRFDDSFLAYCYAVSIGDIVWYRCTHPSYANTFFLYIVADIEGDWLLLYPLMPVEGQYIFDVPPLDPEALLRQERMNGHGDHIGNKKKSKNWKKEENGCKKKKSTKADDGRQEEEDNLGNGGFRPKDLKSAVALIYKELGLCGTSSLKKSAAGKGGEEHEKRRGENSLFSPVCTIMHVKEVALLFHELDYELFQHHHGPSTNNNSRKGQEGGSGETCSPSRRHVAVKTKRDDNDDSRNFPSSPQRKKKRGENNHQEREDENEEPAEKDDLVLSFSLSFLDGDSVVPKKEGNKTHQSSSASAADTTSLYLKLLPETVAVKMQSEKSTMFQSCNFHNQPPVEYSEIVWKELFRREEGEDET